MSIVDSHCHLHFSRISHLLDSIIKDSKSNQIKYFVCNATNTNDWEEVLALSNSNNSILPCIGVHPYFANTITTEELKPQLSSILQQYPSCNVGEIGLDKSSRGKVVPIAQQEALFRLQLQLAKEYNRIPMIHCVRCYGKVLEILRDELSEPTKFLMHGFNGPFNMIRDFVRLGGYISINASLFNVCKEYTVSKFPCMIRREDRRKVLDSIPNDRLLVETDSPDMVHPLLWTIYPFLDLEFSSGHLLKGQWQSLCEWAEIHNKCMRCRSQCLILSIDHWRTRQIQEDLKGRPHLAALQEFCWIFWFLTKRRILICFSPSFDSFNNTNI